MLAKEQLTLEQQLLASQLDNSVIRDSNVYFELKWSAVPQMNKY